MGIHAGRNDTSARGLYKDIRGKIGRLYILWLFGIIVSAVELRPQTMNIGGAQFAV
jgi:hypothetical protein